MTREGEFELVFRPSGSLTEAIKAADEASAQSKVKEIAAQIRGKRCTHVDWSSTRVRLLIGEVRLEIAVRPPGQLELRAIPCEVAVDVKEGQDSFVLLSTGQQWDRSTLPGLCCGKTVRDIRYGGTNVLIDWNDSQTGLTVWPARDKATGSLFVFWE